MKIAVYPLLLCLAGHTAMAQQQYLPDSTIRQIDRMFERWNRPDAPGCVVGIVRNDTLLYSKGYGLANLEYHIPNSPASVYHVASVSKQFTGYAIAMLANAGKLKLDDDVRQYLPWFPDLKEKITIAQLLHHTSGIRDHWQLLAVAGTRLQDVITQEQIIKVLSRQQALNSSPGERFNYSNSGYAMLAEIVKAVTGKTLRQYTTETIFKPLGMQDSHFHESYAEVVPNRAYSYERGSGGVFEYVPLSYANTGATSLFTTVNDLAKWVANFYDTKAGTPEDLALLLQRGKLNNGKEIDYALGIGHFTDKGWRGLAHSGSDAGYRTMLAVFPELKMGFMVLANVGDFNPGQKAMEMAALFVKEKSPAAKRNAPEAIDSSLAKLKDPAALQPFTGSYISDEGTRMAFRLGRDCLYVDAFGRTDVLRRQRDTFYTFAPAPVKFVFSVPQKGDTTAFVSFGPGQTALLQKYNTGPQTAAALEAYVGTYYSAELDCSYGIALKNNRLVLTNSKYDDTPLTLEGPDHLQCEYWWMDHLLVLRNEKKEVTGFEVNNGRVLHLRFNKVRAGQLPVPAL